VGTGSFNETWDFISSEIVKVTIDTFDDALCNIFSSSEIATVKYSYGNIITTTTGVSAKEVDTTPISHNGVPEPVVDQETFYAIIHVNQFGTIFHIGEDSITMDGSSPQKRGNTLDFNFNYTKQ